MPDLAIVIPTRGRPQNITRLIQAWTDTEAWNSADMIVVADADDPEIQRYREFEDLEFPIQVIVEPHWVPMVHKLDSTAVALAEFEYWAVGFAGDDHLPRTGQWADRYLAELRDLGTGIVYGDDGYQGANLPTEWAMTSDVVRTLGRMVPAPVEHMYCDNAVRDLGRAAGCLRYLPDVVIEHVHPMAGKAPTDDQYRRVNSREQFRRDRAAFARWRRMELPAQAAAVRELVPGRPAPPVTAYGNHRSRKGSVMNPNVNVPRRLVRMQGATPMDICVTLADLAAQVPAGRAIVELGVYRGKTSIMMAWGAQQGGRAHVWGIDAWDLPGNRYDKPFTDPGSRNWARYNVKALGFANHVTLIHGFSVEQAEHWSGPPVGLLFVDADHSKEGALADLAAWTPHLAADAVIAFDDYGHPDWPGVAEAVDEAVERGLLEPVQVFHDRLAVTRLGSGHPELVRREQDQTRVVDQAKITAVTSEGAAIQVEREHLDQLPEVEAADQARQELADAIWTGVRPEVPRGGIQFPLPEAIEGDSTEREHPGTGERGEAMEGTPDGTEHVLTAGQAGAPLASGRPVEPAGKAETVPMGIDSEPDPVREAREVVLPSELEGLETQTALGELNVGQLRALAKVRGITLGRDRKTRDLALAALRAGK